MAQDQTFQRIENETTDDREGPGIRVRLPLVRHGAPAMHVARAVQADDLDDDVDGYDTNGRLGGLDTKRSLGSL